ncbi:MAG: PQQ-binding-like beta-propeller repeat protein [Planctomycetaceae bacterium]|nr:PQQ-binding-like beta-propeller repeat protein [Planctomycetaceae bacterium]
MTSVAISMMLLVAGVNPDEAVKWPAFLGAGSTPVEAASLPLTWSPDENIAWKTPLEGYGQSSPVVWQDRVYLTSVEGPNKETNRLVALALSDGKVLWNHGSASTFPVKSSEYVSRAAPTPAVDATAVYAFFESGDLLAASHDGKALWSKSLTREYGEFQSNHGLAASPVLTENAVILLVDHGGPSFVAAFSKTDGALLWKTERKSRQSWASPTLARIAGRDQVVVSSNGSVDGYDSATGKVLWTYDQVGGNTSNTARAFGDDLILVGASAGREGRAAEGAGKSNMALRITAKGDAFEADVAWTAKEATSSFGSPMVHDGLAYYVNRSGVVYCLDARTGEQKYAQRTKQSTWATPVGIGDRVYLFGKDGVTTVLAAGPKFQVLAENSLWNSESTNEGEKPGAQGRGGEARGGPVQYGVAIVPGSLLIRAGDRLYCLRNSAKKSE